MASPASFLSLMDENANWLRTEYLVDFVLAHHDYDYTYPMWTHVADTLEEARAFYYELLAEDPAEAREAACNMLADAGWDSNKINNKRS